MHTAYILIGMFMNRKKACLFFLLHFMWTIPSYADQPLPNSQPTSVNNKQPALPPMSEEELQKLEKELESEINSLVESLPPEEQKQFYKNLEEIEQTINNMSEEELAAFEEEMASFIESMVPQEMLQGEQPKTEEPKETKPESPEVAKEEPKVVKEEKPKVTKATIVSQEKAIEIIDSIIKNTEISLQKIQLIPDISGKIEKWGIQRRIKYWETTLNWNKLKEEIEKLKQQLYTLKEQNPKTKQYKYLPELITDEATCNNLVHVKTTLEEYVSTIDAPAFGLKKLSKPSKTAVRNVISSFTEALYKLKLPEALTTIIKKYDPTAKAIKTEEETAAKKALEETKKPAKIEPTKVAGSKEYGYNGYGSPGSYDPGAASYGYEPYTPRYTPSNGKKKTTTPSKGTSPSNTKKAVPPKGKTAAEEKKAADLTAPKPPAAFKQYEVNRIKQALEDLSINLDKISSAVEKNNKIQQLETHLITQAQPVDHELILHLTNIKKGFEKVATNIEAINFNMKQLSTRQKEEYRKKVSELFKKHQKALEAITKEVVEINKKWETLKDKISDDKKRDYKFPDLIIQLQEQLHNLDEALQRLSTTKK